MMKPVMAILALLLLAAGLRAAEVPAARLAAMDAHALAAPAEAEASVPALAAYLSGPARTDTEKARAIFRWMAERISYFPLSLRPQQPPPRQPEDVLRARRAVCDGYCRLFEALARAAGLETATIEGYAKGYGYAAAGLAGRDYAAAGLADRPDHCWSAVRADGAWRLLDVTWGAGSLNDEGQFMRAFNPHYFFTPPAQLIYDHFPADPRWQLLDPPVSRETFAGFVLVKPLFFRLGLRLDSHPTGRITATDRLRVTLTATEPVETLAALYRDGTPLDSTLTFTQREGDRLAVYAVFPAAGPYTLRLYTRRAGADGAFTGTLDYQVAATAGAGAEAGFPEIYDAFAALGIRLTAPLDGRLPAGTPVAFDVTVPGAEVVGVQHGTAWSWLTRQGDRFTGTVTLRPGEALLATRVGNTEQYRVFLKYRVR